MTLLDKQRLSGIGELRCFVRCYRPAVVPLQLKEKMADGCLSYQYLVPRHLVPRDTWAVSHVSRLCSTGISARTKFFIYIIILYIYS